MKHKIIRSFFCGMTVIVIAAYIGITGNAIEHTVIMLNDKEEANMNMNSNRSDTISEADSVDEPPEFEEIPELQEVEVADISGYAGEVARLVNEEREKRGLKPLIENAALKKIAQVRAVELESAYTHTRPDGDKCFTVYKDYNVTLKPTAENIASGQRLPQTVFDDWMASTEGHMEQIINPDAVYIGVGVHRDKNGVFYWTQLFAK